MSTGPRGGSRNGSAPVVASVVSRNVSLPNSPAKADEPPTSSRIDGFGVKRAAPSTASEETLELTTQSPPAGKT